MSAEKHFSQYQRVMQQTLRTLKSIILKVASLEVMLAYFYVYVKRLSVTLVTLPFTYIIRPFTTIWGPFTPWLTSYFVPFRRYRSLLFRFWTLCVFEPPFGGLRDNVRCSSWAHWKACSGLPISGLPISDNWTFFARCYGWGATSENRSNIGDFAPTQSVWP